MHRPLPRGYTAGPRRTIYLNNRNRPSPEYDDSGALPCLSGHRNVPHASINKALSQRSVKRSNIYSQRCSVYSCKTHERKVRLRNCPVGKANVLVAQNIDVRFQTDKSTLVRKLALWRPLHSHNITSFYVQFNK